MVADTVHLGHVPALDVDVVVVSGSRPGPRRLLRRRRGARVELDYAVVVAHVDVARPVLGEEGRRRQGTLPKGFEVLPGRGEVLDPPVAAVGHEQRAVVAHGHAGRLEELPGPAPGTAELGDEVPRPVV